MNRHQVFRMFLLNALEFHKNNNNTNISKFLVYLQRKKVNIYFAGLEHFHSLDYPRNIQTDDKKQQDSNDENIKKIKESINRYIYEYDEYKDGINNTINKLQDNEFDDLIEYLKKFKNK